MTTTGNFIEVASSANDGPWGTGESFASYCAHSRGRVSGALLFGEMQQLWPEMLLLEGLSTDFFQLVTNTERVLRKFKTASGTGPEEGMNWTAGTNLHNDELVCGENDVARDFESCF